MKRKQICLCLCIRQKERRGRDTAAMFIVVFGIVERNKYLFLYGLLV